MPILVKEVMTQSPHSISPDMHVVSAKKLMARYKIRHLPVLDGKRVVGIVSDRDFALVERSYRGRDFDNEVRVIELCLFKPVTVEENTPVHEVAALMSRRKIGSALVLRNKSLVGIFTATDACRLLAQLAKK